MPRVIVAALAVFATAVWADPPAEQPLAIVHVALIDGTGAPLRPDTTVIATGNRITAIGPAGTTRVPAGARVVDGTGKYLTPGLWDMHVHLSMLGPSVLSILVAAGVTDVRDMGGDLVELKLWRDEIAAGTRLGPGIVMAGPILDGPNDAAAVGYFHLPVANATEARDAVELLAGLGVDFIKVHAGLSRESYLAIVEASRKAGRRFVGHIPGPISAEEASNAGQAMIEHTETLTEKALHAPKDDAEMVRQVLAYPRDQAARLFAVLVKNHTAFDPVLVSYWVWAHGDDPSIRVDPRRDILAPRVIESWKRQGGDDPSWKDVGQRREIFAKLLELVKGMRDAGVELVAGTDLTNPDVLPGFGLHDELALLVSAGLTPMEALQAATRNAARQAGRGRELGTVQVGKLADLVLLDKDPLADIKNVAATAAVVLRGRLIDRAEREQILDQARRAAAPVKTR